MSIYSCSQVVKLISFSLCDLDFLVLLYLILLIPCPYVGVFKLLCLVF